MESKLFVVSTHRDTDEMQLLDPGGHFDAHSFEGGAESAAKDHVKKNGGRVEIWKRISIIESAEPKVTYDEPRGTERGF